MFLKFTGIRVGLSRQIYRKMSTNIQHLDTDRQNMSERLETVFIPNKIKLYSNIIFLFFYIQNFNKYSMFWCSAERNVLIYTTLLQSPLQFQAMLRIRFILDFRILILPYKEPAKSQRKHITKIWLFFIFNTWKNRN